jgi:hypothetical protein
VQYELEGLTLLGETSTDSHSTLLTQGKSIQTIEIDIYIELLYIMKSHYHRDRSNKSSLIVILLFPLWTA